MCFGFFEVPAHIHTFDESLARCARRSNGTSLSRGKLLRCRQAVKTDCMKNKLRFSFFMVGSQTASSRLGSKQRTSTSFQLPPPDTTIVVSAGACAIMPSERNRAKSTLSSPSARNAYHFIGNGTFPLSITLRTGRPVCLARRVLVVALMECLRKRSNSE